MTWAISQDQTPKKSLEKSVQGIFEKNLASH